MHLYIIVKKIGTILLSFFSFIACTNQVPQKKKKKNRQTNRHRHSYCHHLSEATQEANHAASIWHEVLAILSTIQINYSDTMLQTLYLEHPWWPCLEQRKEQVMTVRMSMSICLSIFFLSIFFFFYWNLLVIGNI
jgi:ribonucleotide reductase beta subunit family protein with ferritin-like domain